MSTNIHIAMARAARRGAPVPLLVGALLWSGGLSACLPAPPPGVPSPEDTGVDSGPDAGTCEAARDCSPVK